MWLIQFNVIIFPLYHLELDLLFSLMIPLEWSNILYFTCVLVLCPSYALISFSLSFLNSVQFLGLFMVLKIGVFT